MVKVLAIGCIHGNQGLVKKLAEKAENEDVDIVILAGDLTYGGSSYQNLIGPFAKKGKKVLLIPGNHEPLSLIHFLEEKYSNAKNIHGDSFMDKGRGFFGAGSANIGIHQLTEEEIFSLLKIGHEKVKDREKRIMVTHMHPSGSKSEFSGFKGSKSIRRAIKEFQPDVALFAHIHEASGTEENMGKTRVINVSRKEKIFEI